MIDHRHTTVLVQEAIEGSIAKEESVLGTVVENVSIRRGEGSHVFVLFPSVREGLRLAIEAARPAVAKDAPLKITSTEGRILSTDQRIVKLIIRDMKHPSPDLTQRTDVAGNA